MLLLTEEKVMDVIDIPKEYLTDKLINLQPGEPKEDHLDIRVGMSMKESEKKLIAATLAACGQNKARTARVLEIGSRTLFRKIKTYRLE